MVNLTINNKKVQVPEGTTILAAAAQVGIKIPTLCYLKEINEIASCRICVVEIEGKETLVASCNTVVEEGMVVYTNSYKAQHARRMNVQFILSEHDAHCTSCVKSGNCSLQTVANELNIGEVPFEEHYEVNEWPQDFPLIRNASKCIKCMRCVQICEKVQGLGIWDMINTGKRTSVGVSGRKKITESDCAVCGQCITHCPVGALYERDDIDPFMNAVHDPEKIVVVQIAPAVRAAWGEGLDLPREMATEPCVAKKHECEIPGMDDAGAGPDVDLSLTTRELDRVLKAELVSPAFLEEEEFDQPLGIGSGAGVIFGATGGVMEAALRTAYYVLNGKNPDPEMFKMVRGMDGIREAELEIAGIKIKAAIVNGLGNTRKLMEKIRSGEAEYHFVEVMACPGGCVGGGGQPITDGVELADVRRRNLYHLDKKNPLRFSHENPSVIKAYEDFFEKPLSHKSHELLHTDHEAWKMPNQR